VLFVGGSALLALMFWPRADEAAPPNRLPEALEALELVARSTGTGSSGLPPPWGIDHGANHGELQRYRASQVVGSAQGVSLVAEEHATLGFVSGAIHYGWHPFDETVRRGDYVQAVLRAPEGEGLWSAFWLMPVPSGWLPEIDVVEAFGARPGETMHSLHTGRSDGSGLATERFVAELDTTSWNAYGVHLLEGSTDIYLNGELAGSLPPAPDISWGIIVNLALGGPWAGEVDLDALPATLDISGLMIWSPASTTRAAAMRG
jgi:hypothetical protein